MIAVHKRDFHLLRNLERRFYQTYRSLEEDQGRKENQNIGLQT